MNAYVTIDLRAERTLALEVEPHPVHRLSGANPPFVSVRLALEDADEGLLLLLSEGQADALRRVLAEKLEGKEGEG